MVKFKNILLIVGISCLIIILNYIRNEKSGHNALIYAKRLSLDKFFVSNNCGMTDTVFESNLDKYKTTYLCRDFDAYRYYKTMGGNYLVVKYKSPVTTSKITDLFNGPYYGGIFKELFNCSIISYRDNKDINKASIFGVSTGNCNYDIERGVYFKKLDNYTIMTVDSKRLINLTKMSRDDLELIAKALYGKLLNNYVNLTIPQGYEPEACKININENKTIISVDVCNGSLFFNIWVNQSGLSQFEFPHTFERFYR
jgi:hypothetical protein